MMMEIDAMTATSHWVFHTPRKIGNSAMKPEKPGMPMETRLPMMKPTAGHGMIFAMPPKLRDVPRMCPVIDHADDSKEESRHDAVREHLQAGTRQPFPGLSVERPSITRPMCETDENPMTYLKSVCTKAMKAP